MNNVLQICIGLANMHRSWESLKFVIADAYEGESYKELGKSHNEIAQGFFMDKKLESMDPYPLKISI